MIFWLCGLICVIVASLVPATCEDVIPHEVCNNPSKVVLDIPGLLTNCDPGVGSMIIWNVTDAKQIVFSFPTLLFSATSYGVAVIEITAPSSNIFEFDKFTNGGIDTYTINAVGNTIGTSSVELSIGVVITSCDNLEGQPCDCGIHSIGIVPESLVAVDSSNEEMETLVLPGSVVSRWIGADTELFLVKGKVYYKDGLTPYPGAVVDQLMVDRVRVPEEVISYGSSPEEDGSIFLSLIRILTPGEVLRVRYCTPDECGACSNEYEGPPIDPFSGEVVKFIIPIDPPSFTITPTVTRTATVTSTFTPTASSTPTATVTSTFTPTTSSTLTPTTTDTIPTTFVSERSDINHDGMVNAKDMMLILKDWKKVSGPQ